MWVLTSVHCFDFAFLDYLDRVTEGFLASVSLSCFVQMLFTK